MNLDRVCLPHPNLQLHVGERQAIGSSQKWPTYLIFLCSAEIRGKRKIIRTAFVIKNDSSYFSIAKYWNNISIERQILLNAVFWKQRRSRMRINRRTIHQTLNLTVNFPSSVCSPSATVSHPQKLRPNIANCKWRKFSFENRSHFV